MKLITTLVLILAVTAVICSAATVWDTDAGSRLLHSPHIVGAKPSTYEYNPLVFRLKFYKNEEVLRTCTGSAINTPKNNILWLTAAECVDKDKYDGFILEQMLAGHYDRYTVSFERVKYNIHPDYNNVTKENNIAVIIPPFYLYKDRTSLLPQVPEKNDYVVNNTVHIYLDWKNITKPTDKEDAFELHSIVTRVVYSVWCNLWYPFSPNKKNHVCVSGWYGKGLLQDDIGMPLVSIEEDGRFKLLGLATTIRPWTQWFGLPIEFLSTRPYLDWIRPMY